MKIRYRIFAALLAIFMLASLFACAEASDTPDDNADIGNDSSKEEDICILPDDSGSFIDRLRKFRNLVDSGLPNDLNLDGETVDIDCPFDENGHNYTADWIMAEEYCHDQINNALYERKLNIEGRFDVKLNFFNVDGNTSSNLDEYISVRLNAIRAGLGDIDIHAVQCWAPTIILEGVFEDMNQLNYIDFTRPWWFGDIIDQFTLDGHTTVAYGAITPISIFGGTEVVHFNKNLCEDFGIEDLYQVVRDNRWTYEYAKRITVDCCAELDGKEGYTEGDIYGAMWGVKRLFWALGGYYTTFDESGSPSCDLKTAKVEDIFEKCRQLVSYYQYTAKGGESGDGVDGTWFSEGRIVLYATNLSMIQDSGKWDFFGGVLPLPKLDEAQKNYVAAGYFSGVAIPINATNADTSALVVEALAYYGWRDVTLKYYESIIGYKYSSDMQNAEMLDLMFNNFSYDPIWVYSKATTDLVVTYSQNMNLGFSSFIRKRGTLAANEYNTNIATLKGKYDKLFGSEQ